MNSDSRAHAPTTVSFGLQNIWIHGLMGLCTLVGAALWYHAPHLGGGAFNFMEPECTAAALVRGQGFSNPFGDLTGPTAWVPPLPVWVDSSVFWIAGIKTAAAARIFVVLTVAGLSAAHLILICALRPFGIVARVTASIAFLTTASIVPGGPLEVMSEAWIIVLLSTLLLDSALRYRRSPTRGCVALLCVTASLCVLADAGLALAAAVVLLLLAFLDRRKGPFLAGPFLAAGLATLALGGWTVRNAVVLNAFVPLKSNFWFELYLANVVAPEGLVRPENALTSLPIFDPLQFARYSAMGEIRYIDSYRRPAINAIRENPQHFAGNVWRRFLNAAAFCSRDPGGIVTQTKFSPDDTHRLTEAGLLLPLPGIHAGFWRKIDASPADTRANLSRLKMSNFGLVWRDWAEHRIQYDMDRGSLRSVASGALLAGLPSLCFLMCVLLGKGRLNPHTFWSALIAAPMAFPFVLINDGIRHQIPLIGMAAVVIGCFAQVLLDRLSAPKAL